MRGFLTPSLALVLTLLPARLWAHPHEFVDTTLAFRFDGSGLLGGVSVVWAYDALTSMVILADLVMDGDGDGRLTEAELAELTAITGSWPEDFDGNLYLSQNGQPVALGPPLQSDVAYQEGRLVLSHIRPLPERADPMAGALVLQAYDASYYTFYDLTGLPGATGREGCMVTVASADIAAAQRLYDAALAEMGADLIEQGQAPDLGGAFADSVRVECAPLP